MKKQTKLHRKNNGITLIALVVTIIVLLILAGVALSFITGEDGILGKAQTTTKKYRVEAARELLDLKLIEIDSNYYEIDLRKASFIEIVQGLNSDNANFQIVGTEPESDSNWLDNINILEAIFVCSTEYPDVIFRIEKPRTITLWDEKIDEEKPEPEPEPQKYTVTLNNENGESVTGAGTYEYGSKVTIETTGTNQFDGWYNGSTLYSSEKKMEITVTQDITLTAKYTVLVSGITLKNGSNTLSSTATINGYYCNATSHNSTAQITATIEPSNATNKGVTWTSSNTNVATVSNTGLVTWKGVSGSTKTATITCSSADGNASASFVVRTNGYREYILDADSALDNTLATSVFTYSSGEFYPTYRVGYGKGWYEKLGGDGSFIAPSKEKFDSSEYSKIVYKGYNVGFETCVVYSSKPFEEYYSDYPAEWNYLNVCITTQSPHIYEVSIPSNIGSNYFGIAISGDKVWTTWEYCYLYKAI